MNILVIGAGFTGLSAAYELLKAGHDVTIVEKDDKPGGLAVGFKVPGWDWTLEKHYHHWFANDTYAINLIQEVGLGDKFFLKKPKTDVFIDGKIYPFAGPLEILNFAPFPLQERVRLGLVSAYLKLLPPNLAINLEKVTAYEWLQKYYGQRIFEVIWKPLLDGKFGPYAEKVNMAWFWARIYKRTFSLGYLEGGYQALANRLDEKIKKMGGKIHYQTEIKKLERKKEKWSFLSSRIPSAVEGEGYHTNQRGVERPARHRYAQASAGGDSSGGTVWHPLGMTVSQGFDFIISTTPSPIFLKLFPGLPKSYQKQLTSIPHLHALNLVLVTKEPILTDTYWLNINEPGFPFIALVQHTNFVDKKYYGGNHVAYVGNYLPADHPFLKKTKEELLEIFTPFVQKINPRFSASQRNAKSLTTHYSPLASLLFLGLFAQPVMLKNYSKAKPTMTTPLPNLILANMDMVYPWDRGTNYAIELGQNAARMIK